MRRFSLAALALAASCAAAGFVGCGDNSNEGAGPPDGSAGGPDSSVHETGADGAPDRAADDRAVPDDHATVDVAADRGQGDARADGTVADASDGGAIPDATPDHIALDASEAGPTLDAMPDHVAVDASEGGEAGDAGTVPDAGEAGDAPAG